MCSDYMVLELEYWSSIVFPYLLSVGFSNQEILERINAWDKKSTESRQIRYDETRSFIANNVFESKEILYEIISQFNLVNLYIQGIEGTFEDDQEGLFDYVDGRSGTKFQKMSLTPGLRHKSLTTTSGISSDDVADKCMDILKNGNYIT